MKTWIGRTQDNYNSLYSLIEYDRTFRVAERCGYATPEEMWNCNPLIGGSTDPADFGLVPEGTRMVECSRPPTEREISFGYGARHYKELPVPPGRRFVTDERGQRYTVPRS